MKKIIIGIVVIAIAVGGYFFFTKSNSEKKEPGFFDKISKLRDDVKEFKNDVDGTLDKVKDVTNTIKDLKDGKFLNGATFNKETNQWEDEEGVVCKDCTEEKGYNQDGTYNDSLLGGLGLDGFNSLVGDTELCDENGTRYKNQEEAKKAGLNESEFGATYCPEYKMDPSWDINNDGKNDCYDDNSCSKDLDYMSPRIVEEEKETPKKVSQKTLLILDASGSMWEKVNGEAKITIAKRVIKDTLKNFNDTELGLMAYGHRRKKDCKDIEILSNPQKNNAENISHIVDGISPKGDTPMGASVLMAAESLKYSEEKATVILVSDGIETCDVDLCELGKTLEETGVDFTAHVIGFGMTPEQTAGLKCLAEETGGEFVSAKDSDSLSDALKKAVEKSACSKEKLGESIITAPTEVAAGSTFTVDFTGPKNESDYVSIVPRDSTDSNDHLDYFYPVNDPELKAPVESGDYDIVYFAGCGAILGRTPIVVKEVLASIIAPSSVMAGSQFKVVVTGPKNSYDNVSVMPKGSTDTNQHMSYFYPVNEPKLTAPNEPGEYDIVYYAEGKKELARTTFISSEALATLSVPDSIPAASTFTIEFTGPKNSGDYIALVPKGSTNTNDHLDYFYPVNDPELRAPVNAGEYDIVYWLNGDKDIARKSIKITEVTASLSAPLSVSKNSSFTINFTGPKNSNDFIALVPKGSTNTNDHLDYFYPVNDPELMAPDNSGEYDIVYWLNGEREIARTSIQVN